MQMLVKREAGVSGCFVLEVGWGCGGGAAGLFQALGIVFEQLQLSSICC